MTQRIGAIALILQLATAITLALAVVPIVHTKVIRERVVVPVVIIIQEVHKARVILQAHAVERHVPTANQTPATNAHITTDLIAILITAGTIVTTIVDVAAGAAITAAHGVLIVLQVVAVEVAAVAVAHLHLGGRGS